MPVYTRRVLSRESTEIEPKNEERSLALSHHPVNSKANKKTCIAPISTALA